MTESRRRAPRLDKYALEMIVVLAVITLHDFLLSDVLSLPSVLHRSPLAQFRSLDHVASGLEFVVPAVVFAAMLVLWLTRRNAWERRLGIAYLVWVTARLVLRVTLIVSIILSRPQNGVGVLLKDTLVLWVVNLVLFGAWYWIIDGGGPRARRDGLSRRFDFAFPQRSISLPGWADWQPGFWDYVFLGFSGSTQFGLGDTNVLSLRAKFLMMLQITLSLAILVFMASFAISLMR
jgi:hypothetical protein